MEKLKPLEVELRRLEDLSQDIVNDFAYMKAREEEMRDTNGHFNFLLLHFYFFYNLKVKHENLKNWPNPFINRLFLKRKTLF